MKFKRSILILACCALSLIGVATTLSTVNVNTASAISVDADVAKSVILGVGADESQRQLSWFSSMNTESEVHLAPASSVVDDTFPAEYETFVSTHAPATNKTGYLAYKATITGLEENTEYAYRIFSSNKTSKIYYFHTGSFGDYEFVFLGDPQLQAPAESKLWQQTLVTIEEEFNSPLIISAGDQICTPDSETQYDYFIVDEMANAAFAPSIGPVHDDPSTSYKEHYNVPNESTKYGVTSAGGNYWYTYNNTLFMHLNMADVSAVTNGEHKKFLQETMAANPDVTWNFVVMHSSLFSTGSHSDPSYPYYGNEIGLYRNVMAPMFSELDIDVVLSGHDHVYVRSQMMVGTKVSNDEIIDSTVYKPEGTLYLCASSSTGTKFYNSYGPADYIGYENVERRKSAVKFTITDTTILLESYFLDKMEVFDTFTISTEYPDSHVCEPTAMEETAAQCGVNGKQAYFLCKCGKAYEDEAGALLIENFEEWGIIPALEHSFTVPATCTKPLSCENCNATQGKALGHDLADATCTKAKSCQREGCGVALGAPLGHDFADATCTEAKTCQREGCGAVEGEPLEHDFTDATCTEAKTCKDCGVVEGEPLEHDFADATCTEAKICKNCGATDGKALGHSAKSEWLSDANNHWRQCQRCNEKMNNSTHADNDNNGKCDSCNYQMSTQNNTNGNNQNQMMPMMGCYATASVSAIIPTLLAVAFVYSKKRRK